MVTGVESKNQMNFATTECRQQKFEFQGLGSRKVTADFSGGYLSSDAGGALLLRELDCHLSLIDRLAECFDDLRFQPLVEHSVPQLLRQRQWELVRSRADWWRR